MTPEQFTYWLQGFAELNSAPPSPAQWKSIQDHLKTVFHKVTPQITPDGSSIQAVRAAQWGSSDVRIC